MRGYWATLRARFLLLLQYRAAALAGLFTQCFFGLVLVMVYTAFFHSSNAPQPMSVAQVVTYVWLGQALYYMLPWGVDGEVAGLIRGGNVAYELLRPLDLYGYWYARTLAQRTAPTLLRAVPMVVIAMLFLGMQPPESPAGLAAFAAAVAGAVLLTCALNMIMVISMLWTLAGDGVVYFVGVIAMFCSGIILPLPLFPDWAQAALRALPFSGVYDAPFRLYLGLLPPDAVFGVLAHQLAWTAALVLFGRFLLARGCRRLVVQGG